MIWSIIDRKGRMQSEQGVLRLSLCGIVLFAAIAITFGLVTGSSAILFDGVFSIMDAVMSVASIWVAGLIARSAAQSFSAETRKRFRWGFWHLEPMLIAVNAVMMMGVAVYAIIQSVQSILDGGREIEFGPAMVYAVIILTLTIVLATIEHRANRKIGSILVETDVKGWIMSGGITAALLVAFLIGYFLQGTSLEWFTPYVDPVVLLIVAVILVPVPLGILRAAMADILFFTPIEMQEKAERCVHRLVEENGFESSEVYTSKMVRSYEVQIFIRVPHDDRPRKIQEWDELREPVIAELSDNDPNRFVTVTFTSPRHEPQKSS